MASGGFASRLNLPMLISLTFLLEPKLFVKIPAINYLYIAGAVFVFFGVVIKLAKRNIKPSGFFVAAILYRAALLPQTLLMGGELLDWGYYSITLISVVGYFECQEDEKRRVSLIDTLAYLLLAYLLINAVLMLMYPKGIVDGLYFLGYRTRVVEVLMAALAASSYIDCQLHRLSIRTVFIVVFGAFQILNLWVATALVGVAVAFGVYVAMRLLKDIDKSRLFNVITILGILLTLLFCVFNIQELFAGLIQDVLHKSVSLSNRTDIWKMAIDMIQDSPVFGYGIVDDGGHILWITSWNSLYWQAHNNILQIMLDGGCLCLIPYLVMLFYVGRSVKRHLIGSPFLDVALAIWAAFNVMSVSEIFVLQNYYFVFLVLVLMACRIENDKRRKEAVNAL